VKLGNPEGFGDRPMLDIGEAGVSVKFMPLLQHRVEVGTVSMSDVAIDLVRKAGGKTNWDDLGGAGKETRVASPERGENVASLTISGIEISNARVTFSDVDQTTELKDFNLKASNIELGQPFDLKGGFSINLPRDEVAGQVEFGGRVSSADDGKHYGIDGFSLTFKGTKGFEGRPANVDVYVATDADIDLSKDQAVLSYFTLKLNELSVMGDFTVSSLTSKPRFAGQLKVAEFNPKSLLRSMHLDTPLTSNENALTRVKADMKFTGTNDSADVQDLVVVFDDSTFKGNLKVAGFSDPALDFELEVDRLNLDDYLPPADRAANTAAADVGKGAASTAAAGAENSGADLSAETFRGFTGGGDFRVGKLVVAGLTATDVDVTMKSDGKSVRFDPVDAIFYDGKHHGEITIDASGQRPLLAANLGLSDVQVDSLLSDLTGSARLKGIGDFSLRIHTDLTNSQTVMQDMSGDIGMKMHDGEIVGIDVVDTIATVKSLLGKQSEMVAESGQDQATKFAELTMSGVIDNGVLSSDDLVLKSPLLSATGKGTLNLVDESIDYVLKPVLTGKSAGQNLGELEGVPIPIRLTGNLYEPDIRVDVVAALAASQKDRIDKKKDELINKLLGEDENADKESGSTDETDAAKALLKGILGGKKKPEKDKDGGGAD